MNKKVGEKIRQLRAVRGLSQDNIADEIGMSAGNYGKIERGEIDISTKHLMEIARALKVNVADFFEEKKVKESRVDYGYATKEDLLQLTQTVKILAKEIETLRDFLPKRKARKKPGKK